MPRHLAALSAMALSLVAPQWAGATTYTRDEAVRIALEKSSDVKTAEEEVISANSQVDAGYGKALPSIDLDATVTRIFGLDDVNPSDSSMAMELISLGQEKGFGDPSPWDAMALGAINGVVNGMKSQALKSPRPTSTSRKSTLKTPRLTSATTLKTPLTSSFS